MISNDIKFQVQNSVPDFILEGVNSFFPKQLGPILKGKNTAIIYGSTGTDFTWWVKQLDLVSDDFDTVILYTSDVFLLRNNKNIFEHPTLTNKRLFLFYLGYENKKIKDSQWEISWPEFYFNRSKTEKNIKPPGLSYKFSSLNSRASAHRLILGYNLYKNNLLNQIMFTQNTIGGWWTNNYPAPDVVSTIPDFQSYINLLPIKYQDEITPTQPDLTNNHPAYNQAYCNIVTETEAGDDVYQTPNFNDTIEIITEKSYKPFVSCQVPLFLACKGHLRHLKNLGFEVFENLLPAGYDTMGVQDKISAIVEIVSRGGDFMENFYFSHLKEIEHNYELISSDKVEQLILNNIKNLLNPVK